MKAWTNEILRVKEVERFEKYLGLPTLIGRGKYQTFSYLKDRVWKKLQGWKRKLLFASRERSLEFLIKAVAQTIPTYTMRVFLLPMKLCDELNALCAWFWYGLIREERKIHWKSWSVLTQSKKVGGMGFRDLRSFNLAILAKQGWRLLQNQESLVYQCFKARYFPHCSLLEAADSPNNSYVWKSIMVGQPVLKTSSCLRVGDGSSISPLCDKWIPNHLWIDGLSNQEAGNLLRSLEGDTIECAVRL
ncbi:putative mitochondrial protein AtMg00310 [Castanea sativa]|uniref:putative mitochondrial protein AtMg00310 n=1 Tax=Castanea sativa TaxID=21020 RepID=UPI003F64B76B